MGLKKFNDLIDKEKCHTNVCGGFNACVDRTCDKTQADCQECIEEATQSIAEVRALTPRQLLGLD